MNILNIREPQIIEMIGENKKNLLSLIFDNLFLICKNDPLFSTKTKSFDNLDDTMEDITKKLDKYNELINTSKTLKEDLSRKLRIIELDNIKTKEKLLDILGSEL